MNLHCDDATNNNIIRKIRYTWVQCFTHDTHNLRNNKKLFNNCTSRFVRCKDGYMKGDYCGCPSFVILGDENHDKILQNLKHVIYEENKKTPEKHKAEIITVYEESTII